MAFCRLSVDNLPHSPYNTNAYAMFVDVSVYEEVLMDIFEKCERRSRVALKRSRHPLYTIGVFYRFASLLLKLLPAQLGNWLLGKLYAN